MAENHQKDPPGAVPVPDLGDAAGRVQDLNQHWLDAAKQVGNMSLDAYERSLDSLIALQTGLADSTGLEWWSALARTQASFWSQTTTAYTNAAREALR